MSKVAKGKGKTRGKKWKNRKMCWGARQQIDRHLSKLPFEAIGNVFCIKAGTYIKKNLSLCMANFGWWRLLCSKSGRQREAPPVLAAFTKDFFFFSWQNGTLSFFYGPVFCCFFFLPRTFFRFWFFYEQLSFLKQRASTCELCKVRDVNKIWK